MFTSTNKKWFMSGALALAMAASLAGAGSASAQTVDANLSVVSTVNATQLTSDNTTAVPAGTTITVHGASFDAGENIGLWVNLPAGVTIPSGSLGQTGTVVEGGVAGLNQMAIADDNGDMTYTLDTNGLPAGTYSLVAHGLASDKEQILEFTITQAQNLQLTTSGDTTVPAGTVLSVSGTSFQANEPVGMWINVSGGVTIPEESLGQDNTYVDGTVIPLNAMGWADSDGSLGYSLDTTGLPAGTYSLVAHGLNSGLEEVLTFTIK